jgi:hypothetical protein
MDATDDTTYTNFQDAAAALLGHQPEPCPHCHGTGIKPSEWDSPEDEFVDGVRSRMENADV